MKNIILLTISTILMVQFSCIPFNRMESAKTLGKGVSTFGGTVSSYTFIDDNISKVTVPYLDMRFQIGVTDKLDLSAGLNSIGFFMADGKYQLVGDQQSKFALSAGLGVDVFALKINGKSVNPNIKISIPIYTSYHFNDKLYYYFIPQYAKQIIFKDNEDNIDFLGGSTGIGIASSIGEFSFGGAYFKPLISTSSNGAIVQIGVGYKYKFD